MIAVEVNGNHPHYSKHSAIIERDRMAQSGIPGHPRRDSKYVSGRSRNWLKSKNRMRRVCYGLRIRTDTHGVVRSRGLRSHFLIATAAQAAQAAIAQDANTQRQSSAQGS